METVVESLPVVVLLRESIDGEGDLSTLFRTDCCRDRLALDAFLGLALLAFCFSRTDFLRVDENRGLITIDSLLLWFDWVEKRRIGGRCGMISELRLASSIQLLLADDDLDLAVRY